jgi:hypothetical protein
MGQSLTNHNKGSNTMKSPWTLSFAGGFCTIHDSKGATVLQIRDGVIPASDVTPLILAAPAMLHALKNIVGAYTLECNETEAQRRINVAVEIIRAIEQTS